MQLKPKRWELRFQDRSMVLNEAVSDVARRLCLCCGDGMWWRTGPRQFWKCRTCNKPDANAKVFWTRRSKVVDPTDAEIEAIQAASEPAGEYLESIGKTDLATLEESEWMTLLEVVVTAYTDKLQELGA